MIFSRNGNRKCKSSCPQQHTIIKYTIKLSQFGNAIQKCTTPAFQSLCEQASHTKEITITRFNYNFIEDWCHVDHKFLTKICYHYTRLHNSNILCIRLIIYVPMRLSKCKRFFSKELAVAQKEALLLYIKYRVQFNSITLFFPKHDIRSLLLVRLDKKYWHSKSDTLNQP